MLFRLLIFHKASTFVEISPKAPASQKLCSGLFIPGLLVRKQQSTLHHTCAHFESPFYLWQPFSVLSLRLFIREPNGLLKNNARTKMRVSSIEEEESNFLVVNTVGLMSISRWNISRLIFIARRSSPFFDTELMSSLKLISETLSEVQSWKCEIYLEGKFLNNCVFFWCF